MKNKQYILLIVSALFMLFACDSPTEIEDNIKRTSIEKNYSESSGMLIEIDTSQIEIPIEDSIIVYDSTNFKGSNTGISEVYLTGTIYQWQRQVFWFDAFKIETDVVNKTLSLNVDINTNDLQEYDGEPPNDRIISFQIQLKDIDFSTLQKNIPINDPFGDKRWASYKVKSIMEKDSTSQFSKVETISGRYSKAIYDIIPHFDEQTGDLKAIDLNFSFEAPMFSYYRYPFYLYYRLTLLY